VSAAAALSAQAADDHKGHDHDNQAAAHAHDAKAAHGGVVSVVKDLNYELVARPDTLALYVSDHGQPVDLKGATSKLTLLSAKQKIDVALAPAGDRLEAKGSFPVAAGTKAMALVTLPGQAPTAVKFTVK
jgi:hypothetical protein